MIRIVFTFFLLVTSSIYTQESSELTINFRNALRAKNFDLAENLLSKMNKEELELARYELLETELWIEKGEALYQNNQFKSSFPYFKNAYERWRTNNFVRDRYNELSSKVLTDEKSINVERTTNNPSIGMNTMSKELIAEFKISNHNLQSISEGINSLENEIKKSKEESSKNNLLLASAILIQALAFLLYSFRKK